ncbi:MAG: hypothetical protein HC900_03170 [Methylacidiphilales bacterium]|nr:hypothetical protein [Candidatus Methylacidiphilales bacterium]
MNNICGYFDNIMGKVILVCACISGISGAHAQSVADACITGAAATAMSRNLYLNNPGSLGLSEVCGSRDSPIFDKRPIVWIEKYITSDKTGRERFDNGAAYFQLVKKSGSAHGVAVTGSTIQLSGSGNLIGVHGRASGSTRDSELFGGWFYANSEAPFRVMTGVEINLRNRGHNSPWLESGFPHGTAIGLNISMADRSTFPGTHAMYVAAQKGSMGWRTGVFFNKGAIEPTDAAGNGEAFRIHGAPGPAKAFKLLRARKGSFVSGLETVEAHFERGVLEMAKEQYLAWGGTSAAGGDVKLGVTETNVLNFTGNGLRLRESSEEPKDPQEGTIAFADGQNWNPGQGRGFYGFENGGWRKL